MQRFAYAAILAALLSACGGGGGGAETTAPAPVSTAAVSFSPAKVSASFQAGTSTSLTVAASINKPSDFAGASAVYAYVVDEAGVILPDAKIVKVSDLQYNAVLQTAPTLAAGNYKGNFTLKLCRDSACASAFPGSPVLLPYEFTVSKDSSTPAPVADGALTFTPSTVQAAFTAGTSSTLTVAATVRKPADFAGASAVYTYVVDTAGVILPDAQIFKLSDLEYSAVLKTSPSLAAGNYQGSFEIKLCRDSACASQFPGSPSLLPYNFAVAKPAPLAFSASASAAAPLDVSLHQGTTASGHAGISVAADGLTWSARSDAAWLKVGGGNVTGSATVDAAFDAANLAQGKYTATVTVTAADGRVVLLPASLTILPNVFVADKSGLAFSAINGAPIASQAVQFIFQSGVTGNWSAATDAAWLSVSPGAGATPGGTTVTVNPAVGALISGTHTAKLTLTAPLASTPTQIPVALTLVKPTLSASATSVTLGGATGRSFSSQPLTLTLNTAGNAWPWTLSAPPAWATASKLSGTVSQAGASLNVVPNPAQAAVGSTTVMLSASAKVNGDTVTRPISLTINKDQRKVLASETGVALTSTPGWSRLSRTLKVNDNFAQGGTWKAQSDKAWLTVTASGVSGGNLALSANPAALPQDTISYATITLSSDDASISAPESIKVALWRGSATPSAITKLSLNYKSVIADPIRPLIYAISGANIDVYNVYTAQKIGAMTVATAVFGDAAISPNGDRLYLEDLVHGKLQVMNLSNWTALTTWPLASRMNSSMRLKVVRPNGVELVLRSEGSAYVAASGKLLSGVRGGTMAASANGKRVYVLDEGLSPATLTAFDLDYSDISGGTLFVSAQEGEWGSVGENGQDVAVNADGTRLYGASGYPYLCSALNGGTLSFVSYLPGGEAYPNNVEVGSDGRVFCGNDGIYSEKDIWVHRADGTLQSSFKVVGYAQGLLPRQMVVSGDGMMVVALTSDPLMAIVPVGP